MLHRLRILLLLLLALALPVQAQRAQAMMLCGLPPAASDATAGAAATDPADPHAAHAGHLVGTGTDLGPAGGGDTHGEGEGGHRCSACASCVNAQALSWAAVPLPPADLRSPPPADTPRATWPDRVPPGPDRPPRGA